MKQPILQQYYTRARQGIFRSTEGYDTIAKSDRLDNNFIKKTLHPFCGYDVPKELQKRSEKDLSKYPESVVFFHGESGELILGRSVYVGADFTGQRNTFFSHNYVIPAERREEFLQQPEKIFAAGGFVDRCDDAMGKSLPELAEIPLERSGKASLSSTSDAKAFLAQVGIDEKRFMQLLYAVMTSVGSKKKVYITLDAELAVAAVQARQLLGILFSALPYEMRRHFGFITYCGEPESKKYINVMFVENGSIRAGDAQLDKEFLFDFPNQRFVNTELPGSDHTYLSLAWNYLQEPELLKQFYAFAEEVLAGADTAISLRVATYYELAALYLVEKGSDALYSRNKEGILRIILEYLGNERLREKRRLHELFMGLFREESHMLSGKNLPSADLVKQFVSYYALIAADSSQSNKIAVYLLDVLVKAKDAGAAQLVADVYKLILDNEKLSALIFTTIFRHEQLVKPLFEEFLIQRVSGLSSVKSVLQEIAFWSNTTANAVKNRYFQRTIQEKLCRLLEAEREPSAALMELHQYFAGFELNSDFAESVINEVDKCFLKNLDLGSITKEVYNQILAILSDKPQIFFQQLSRESSKKCDLLLYLADLQEKSDALYHEGYFKGYSAEDVDLLQQMLRNVLCKSVERSNFLAITSAFYNPDSPVTQPYRFSEMLQYVGRYGGPQASSDFIIWSLKRSLFFTGRKFVPAYRQAIKHHFLHVDPEALRDKISRKMWFGLKHPELRKLVEEVRDENSNGAVRFFRRYMDKLLIGLAAVVSVGTVGWVLFLTIGAQNPPAEPVPTVNDIPHDANTPATPGKQPDGADGTPTGDQSGVNDGGNPKNTDSKGETGAGTDSNPGTQNGENNPAQPGTTGTQQTGNHGVNQVQTGSQNTPQQSTKNANQGNGAAKNENSQPKTNKQNTSNGQSKQKP